MMMMKPSTKSRSRGVALQGSSSASASLTSLVPSDQTANDETRDKVPPLPRRPYSSLSAGSGRSERPSSALSMVSTLSDDLEATGATKYKVRSPTAATVNTTTTTLNKVKPGAVASPLSRAKQQQQQQQKPPSETAKTLTKAASTGKMRSRPVSYHAGTALSSKDEVLVKKKATHQRSASNTTSTTVSTDTTPPTPPSLRNRPLQRRPLSAGLLRTPPQSPALILSEEDYLPHRHSNHSSPPPSRSGGGGYGSMYTSPRVASNHIRPMTAGSWSQSAEPLGARDPVVETRNLVKRMLELDNYYGIGNLG